ncbi:MAG: hypothetical protein WB816_05255 [Methylocystis sp.]
MKRKFVALLLLLAVAAPLSGCDKCGGFQELRSPIPPKTCSGDSPR